MRKIIEGIEGKKYGHLTVLKKAPVNGTNYGMWECVCDCGKHTFALGNALTHGKRVTCGHCIYRCEKGKKHGQYKTRLYKCWSHIKDRCNNPNCKSYKHYGERGIKICEEWNCSFENFQSWALENGYSEDLTIDRINPNGNYCPENCRWVTKKEQANNKRKTIYIDLPDGTMTLLDASKKYNLDYGLLNNRYNRGYRGEKLIREVETRFRSVSRR